MQIQRHCYFHPGIMGYVSRMGQNKHPISRHSSCLGVCQGHLLSSGSPEADANAIRSQASPQRAFIEEELIQHAWALHT